jgi:hypothetical protein
MRVIIAVIASIFMQFKGGAGTPVYVINHMVQARRGFGFAF